LKVEDNVPTQRVKDIFPIFWKTKEISPSQMHLPKSKLKKLGSFSKKLENPIAGTETAKTDFKFNTYVKARPMSHQIFLHTIFL